MGISAVGWATSASPPAVASRSARPGGPVGVASVFGGGVGCGVGIGRCFFCSSWSLVQAEQWIFGLDVYRRKLKMLNSRTSYTFSRVCGPAFGGLAARGTYRNVHR